MGTREKGSERWRTENESMSGGAGSHDDISNYGRSSEYGANFRDSSMYGGDRSQQGRFAGNEHYQGNDAGVPYQANRHGQEDGGWSGERYGSQNRYGSQERYGSQDRYGSQNRYGSDQSQGYYGRDRSMSGKRFGNEYGNRSMRDYGSMFGSEYGNRMSSSIPDYDSSMYGVGQSDGYRGTSSWRQDEQRGERDETMLQKVGRFFGIGPKGYKRSDSRIQEDVNDALMDDAYVDATHIEVNVKDGEVTLEGYVEDRNTKRRAEDVVCNVRGIKDCHNHLKIRPLSQSNIDSTLGTSATTNGQGERKDRNRQSSVS